VKPFNVIASQLPMLWIFTSASLIKT